MKAKQLFLGLGLVVALVATMAVPALAEEKTVPASLTVNEVINFTITDNDAVAGINFGSVNAGTTARPEIAQDATKGAVVLTVGAETNVDCWIQLKGGSDFMNGANKIPLSNAKYNMGNTATGALSMTTTYVTVSSSVRGAASNVNVWHWLDVPAGAAAGNYSTTFYYQAVKK